MALGTINKIASENLGAVTMKVFTIVGDTSYPTHGSSLTPAMLGFSSIVAVIPEGVETTAGNGTTSFQAGYDPVNFKLKVYGGASGSGAAGAEVTNATNLSTFTITIVAFGHGL